MASDNDRAIERPSDLTVEWLTATLGAGTVSGFTTERIGTGQMSECYRVALTYSDGSGPESVVLKVAASDPMSRQTGLTLGLYEREVRFYHDIAPRLGGAIAPCYHAAVDLTTGVFDLLLGDAAPAVVGDEIAGATGEQAHLAVVELARLHGPLLADAAAAAAEWLNRDSPLSQAIVTTLYAGFIDRYGNRIAPRHRTVCDQLIAAFDGYLAQEAAPDRVRGLVHGDYRLDNLLFGTPEADRSLTVVDWQTVSWGPACTDLAYFLGCALPPQDRRTHYDELLQAYHAALGSPAPITLDDVRESVRRQSFFGVMMAIVSSMLVERTERGDQMFMTMLERHCDHVLDTDALATLPTPAQPEPLRPSGADESAHPATDEPLWSESWYADFVSATEGLGGWFRLGLIPNQGRAWIHAVLCGPDLPTVAVIDVDVPLPTNPWQIRTDVIELGHAADAPLQSYRVSLRAQGQSYQDPAALLRGEAGEPVDVTLDLEWTTAGVPYQYRVTTRYEIPCTVSGTVVVKHARYQIDSVPGQRDHSWGVRDWWSMNWMWSALHLDDGAHLHALSLVIPNTGELGIGYIQGPAGSLTELQTVNYREAFADNGLPLDTDMTLAPGDLIAQVEVRAHAPVLLTAEDGRLSQFPRAWVDLTTSDGRNGVGWMEWNRNQA
ncbi:phosphotransferase [Mycobacterium sp. 1423905.2]|uniref:DUF7064 domain-containing protein n=1 Tax=Mycobacterium sp. 1423905.2 TaxID=1856859 RepID=UPI0007FF3B85|nr:phosphotransferase [Mycobacterium sp. 1423905.2]OBJ49336.1 phosphotransferase [Mycobacterium sp. 1423905.2]